MDMGKRRLGIPCHLFTTYLAETSLKLDKSAP
jgi:hypothetical protein